MKSIELMVDEHKYIKRMLIVLRQYSYKVVKGEEVDISDFYSMIDFVRNFADKHHHGKEEEILFREMMAHQGPVAEKLIKHGMLVEHDLGRLHMMDLEAALKELENGNDEAKIDIIANAVGYAALLTRHIDKEDNVVYPYAEKGLPEEVLRQIDDECEQFEIKARKEQVHQKYIAILEELEAKLGILKS